MFYGKRINAIEEKILKFEQFEKSICKIIDNYFETNEKHDLNFSTDYTADKFYHFVKSIDEKFKKLGKIEEENADLREETVAQEETIIELEETVKTKDEIIHNQEKEIENLQGQLNANKKTATARGGKR